MKCENQHVFKKGYLKYKRTFRHCIWS